jgi:hypothetical protein
VCEPECEEDIGGVVKKVLVFALVKRRRFTNLDVRRILWRSFNLL